MADIAPSLLLAALFATGCRIQDDASFRRATADRTGAGAVAGAASPAAAEAAEGAIAEGPVGASVRRGRAIVLATRDSLPRFVGNGLRCASCHLDEGRRPFAMPFTGLMARYPQYRRRGDRIERLEDKVNDCFRRSMAGRPLPWESTAMRDLIAYFAHLSRGVPVGTAVAGQSVDSIRGAVRGDTARGRTVYVANCARCHGAGGEGSVLGTPVWGPRSFTIGAGMARWRVAAAFVRHNMPNDRRESLSDQEAVDVATFLLSMPRRDFAGKERDWPQGNPPDDAPYRTTRRANIPR
ncbi:MAG: c-type cytochrome [Gemmatimonadetes bacterium]|nr:c-type cytochrome [Gemmatimonadota bacterium]